MCPSAPPPLAHIDAYFTDEELVLFLGGRKVGDPIPSNVITEVNPFSVEPWDSPENMWYLYNLLESQSHGGGSVIEVTDIGYWRSLNDLRIVTTTPTVGRKTTREFYIGQAPFGDRTGWIMHEYQAEQKSHFGTNKDYSFLCRVFLQNDQRTNSEEQDNPVTADDADGEYLESRLLSLLEQEESNTSGNHGNRIQSQPASSERSPRDLGADNPAEDMHATFDFSKGDYLELKDLCSIETSSSNPDNSATYDFSKGEYLELNDLYSSETSSSSSDNSSLMSINSEEYFDPNALLRDLENASDRNTEEEHVNFSFSVSASVRSNQVVIKPPPPGLVHSNNGNLVVEESVPANSMPVKRRASSPSLTSSAVEVRHNGKASTSGISKGSQANQTPRCSQGVTTPQGLGSRSPGRIKKLGKKYWCFGSF